MNTRYLWIAENPLQANLVCKGFLSGVKLQPVVSRYSVEAQRTPRLTYQ